MSNSIEPKVIETWIAHLEQELTAHRDLLAASDAKTRALVERDIPKLEALIQSEREALEILQQLRIRRQRLRILSAKALNVPPDDLRMPQVVAHADEKSRTELLEQERQIKEVVAHLQRVNERNSTLQRTSLALVSEVLTVISGAEHEIPTYNRGGYAVEGPRQGGGLCSFEA